MEDSISITQLTICSVADVPKVIDGLLHTRPSTQRATIEEYYTPTVAFHHPFCYVPSFSGGRWLVLKLYQWYKIMSPRVEHEIHSIGDFHSPYNPNNLASR